MYCYNKIGEDLYWIGGSDRKIPVFEGVVPVTDGMAYNSYFIDDEKTVVVDAVDHVIAKVFYENVEHLLAGRDLDYIIVNHVEPDHSASLEDLMIRNPKAKVVGTVKIQNMIKQYIDRDIDDRFLVVKEGEELSSGKHTFTFINAPMVHWPEVMVTYDKYAGTLFSADAFGIYGSIDGNIFADKYDFDAEWLPEARRYYTTIVGKYGMFTEKLLAKVEELDVKMICPLHGYVIRKDLDKYINAYHTWARYEAEDNGVLIVYASPYGNTKNAVDILASELVDLGVDRMKLMDASKDDPMKILPHVFRFKHLVLAAPTYNTEIFVTMEEALGEMRTMGVSNKKISIIENGSWQPMSGKKMREFVEKFHSVEFIGETVTIKSAVKAETREALEKLAKEIAASVKAENEKAAK